MKKIIVIADWVDDSLSCQEFRSTVEGFLKEPEQSNINFVSSSPSTIHTGFLIGQTVEIEERFGRPLKTIVFQNTDPRLNVSSGKNKTKGAEFIIIKLKSGLYLCGPNAGNNFSFIKSKIEEVFLYPNLDSGTQFRSRDLYSRVCAHLMDEMEDELEIEEIQPDVIPTIKGSYIGHVDNYGNIKTSISQAELKGKYEFGDEIVLEINKVKKKAKYVSGLFGGTTGELVIYPGSSGAKDNPYLEISVWRHFNEENPTTGKAEFNNPLPGSSIIF